MNKLVGIYKHQYNEVKKTIQKRTKNDLFQRNVLTDIYDMFYNAQINNVATNTLFGNIQEFIDNIIESLTPRRKISLNTIFIIILISIITIVGIFIFHQRKQTLEAPIIWLDENIPNRIHWTEVENALKYEVYIEGERDCSTPNTHYNVMLREHGKKYNIQIKAIAPNYQPSISKRFIYKVPDKIIKEVDFLKGDSNYINVSPINFYTEAFFQITPLVSGYYEFTFNYYGTDIIFDSRVDVYNIKDTTKEIREHSINQKFIYYLNENDTYIIILRNLDRTKDFVNMSFKPISFDVNEEKVVQLDAYLPQTFILENIRMGLYHFTTTSYSDNISIQILDENFQVLNKSIDGIAIIDNNRPHYLKIVSNVTSEVTLTTLTPHDVTLNDEEILIDDGKEKLYIYDLGDGIYELELLQNLGKMRYQFNFYNQDLKPLSYWQVGSSPIKYIFHLDGRVTKIYIYIYPYENGELEGSNSFIITGVR